MARIGYVSRDTMPEGRTDLYDRLAAERGPNLEHIFLALANAPDLAEAVLGLATALRKKTTLSRVFRELAVVTVGLETDAQYEVEHHWNAALRALQFGHFETVKPGEILDFSLGKSFLFFCWPQKFVRCNDIRKWSHYIFRAVH